MHTSFHSSQPLGTTTEYLKHQLAAPNWRFDTWNEFTIIQTKKVQCGVGLLGCPSEQDPVISSHSD